MAPISSNEFPLHLQLSAADAGNFRFINLRAGVFLRERLLFARGLLWEWLSFWLEWPHLFDFGYRRNGSSISPACGCVFHPPWRAWLQNPRKSVRAVALL